MHFSITGNLHFNAKLKGVQPKGIYCLEIGEWYGSLKKKTSDEAVAQLHPVIFIYIHYYNS